MASLCEKTISACISADCENPLFAGVNAEALIFNFNQVDSLTYKAGNGNIVTAITMGTYEDGGDTKSFCAYTVQQLGNKPYDGSQVEMAEGTYGNKFTNTVQLAIVDNGPDIAHDIIDNLANGKFMVMLQNDYKHANGDNKYQLYGTAKGLKATAISREVWGDNESAYIVTLTEEGNPKSGVFFYDTDESTTDDAVAALKCTCA